MPRAARTDGQVEGRPSPAKYAVTRGGDLVRGEELRRARVAAGLVLREAARSLYMKASDLCDVEWGRLTFKNETAWAEARNHLARAGALKGRAA